MLEGLPNGDKNNLYDQISECFFLGMENPQLGFIHLRILPQLMERSQFNSLIFPYMYICMNVGLLSALILTIMLFIFLLFCTAEGVIKTQLVCCGKKSVSIVIFKNQNGKLIPMRYKWRLVMFIKHNFAEHTRT